MNPQIHLKEVGLQACSTNSGIIAAIALDQRNTLRKMIEKEKGGLVSDLELIEFKAIVTEVLTSKASAILLDTYYGLEAISRRAPKSGVLLSYDKSGFDPEVKGRLPGLIPEWSVRRLLEAGADSIKVMIYYDPDDDPKINEIKHVFIERVGAECNSYKAPFFFEPLCYDNSIIDEKSLEFARVKPQKVAQTMLEFSKPQYMVDVLKVEPPVNIRFVQGSVANIDHQFAYTYSEALEYFAWAGSQSCVPFIFLSAGVSEEAFLQILAMAGEAKVPFSGVLCGRSTWQGGIQPFIQSGSDGLRDWLEDRGIQNVLAINSALEMYATPLWKYYQHHEKAAQIVPPGKI